MQRHLNEVIIHRFRGLRSVTLSDLGAVNLIVGANNSGKTSVLEAVSTFCRPFDLTEWIRTILRRENKPMPQIIEDDLRWLFAQDDIREAEDPVGLIHISGSGVLSIRELIAQYKHLKGEYSDRVQVDVDEEGDPVYEDGTFERVGAQIDLTVRLAGPDSGSEPEAQTERHQTFTLWATGPAGSRTPIPGGPELRVGTIAPYSHRTERSQQIALLSEAIVGDRKAQVVELLAKLDPTVAGLEIISPSGRRPQIAIRHAELGLMPLSAFGDGVRRVLVFALTVPAVENGILLIDEIENAIHVRALPKVFSWLVDACRTYSVQVLATTHSLEAVDAVLSADPAMSEVVGYRLHQDGQQQTVQRFSGPVLHHLRLERGLDVRWR